jgi:heat shock protein HslJ
MRPVLHALAIGTLVSILPLAGCSMNDSSPNAKLRSPASTASIEGQWNLVALDGKPIGDAAALEAMGVRRTPHMTIADDGAAAGFAGVNRYSTRLTVGLGGEASFAPSVSTRMAGPPQAMALESQFMHDLSRVDSVRAGGDRLVFLSGGTEVLSFTKAE